MKRVLYLLYLVISSIFIIIFNQIDEDNKIFISVNKEIEARKYETESSLKYLDKITSSYANQISTAEVLYALVNGNKIDINTEFIEKEGFNIIQLKNYKGKEVFNQDSNWFLTKGQETINITKDIKFKNKKVGKLYLGIPLDAFKNKTLSKNSVLVDQDINILTTDKNEIKSFTKIFREELKDALKSNKDYVMFDTKDKHSILILNKIIGTNFTYIYKIETEDIAQIKKDTWFKNITTIGILIVLYLFLLTTLNQKLFLKEEVKNKTKELKDINETLEKRIKDEVNKVKEIEQQLYHKEKMSSMGEMIGNIAHQWRQPLTSISTLVGKMILLMEHNQMSKEDAKIDLEKIEGHTEYLSNTIEDFRNFIKNDDSGSRPFNLHDAIDKAMILSEAVTITNHIDIKQNDDLKLTTKGSSNHLTQVIVNLINNSKDAFISNNIKNRQIRIITKKKDDKAHIFFVDNAGGIPEEIRGKIFEPYFTTKHQSRGTGLGLHMSYNIITQTFKGKIQAKNKDAGAVFIMEIPLTK